VRKPNLIYSHRTTCDAKYICNIQFVTSRQVVKNGAVSFCDKYNKAIRIVEIFTDCIIMETPVKPFASYSMLTTYKVCLAAFQLHVSPILKRGEIQISNILINVQSLSHITAECIHVQYISAFNK